MFTANDLRWGEYKQFEGPWFPGVQKFQLPSNPTDNDRILAVMCATEGGAWDAYNGYDSCICTTGLIQWCEQGQYSVSDLFGDLAEAGHWDKLEPVMAFASQHGFTFEKNPKGRWRFFNCGDSMGEVDTLAEQRRLFFLNATGEKGSWDGESKEYAREFGAAIVNVWQDPAAQAVQAAYTVKRLKWFVLKEVAEIYNAAPPTPLGRAFQAAYLSFAGNNPTRAKDALLRTVEMETEGGPPRWSMDWVIMVLNAMTWGSNVAIYPHRYERIRPVLEKVYGVDLPDLSRDLKERDDYVDLAEVQKGLMALGFDLGPAGADGRFGKKTKEAVMSFERLAGLPADGVPEPKMVKALGQMLLQRGIALHGG